MGPQGRITAAKPFHFELSENHSCGFCLFAKNKNPSWAFIICSMEQEKQHKLVLPLRVFVVVETYSMGTFYKALIPLK